MKISYSAAFKEQALAKVFQRGNRTIQSVADELHINVFTLKNWMKQTMSTDQPAPQKAQRPGDWRPEARLAALQESYGLEGEALQAWCREKGLFAHHLAQWAADFCTSTGVPGEGREGSKALRALQAENQQLQRELQRKEKALAEAAALLVLQKKYRALLGEEVA